MKGFVKMPNDVLASEKISPSAKALYAAIVQFRWKGENPTQDQLGQAIGIHARWVRKLLKDLELAELIVKKHRGLGKSDLIGIPERQDHAGPERQDHAGPERQDHAGPIHEDVDIRKEDNKFTPISEKSGGKKPTADERLWFFESCQVLKGKDHTDSFIKDCERLAMFRGWKRPSDPQMFMDSWWIKFKRYKPEMFTAAVEWLIGQTDLPIDRAGHAQMIHRFLEKSNQTKPSLKIRQAEPVDRAPWRDDFLKNWTDEEIRVMDRNHMLPERMRNRRDELVARGILTD